MYNFFSTLNESTFLNTLTSKRIILIIFCVTFTAPCGHCPNKNLSNNFFGNLRRGATRAMQYFTSSTEFRRITVTTPRSVETFCHDGRVSLSSAEFLYKNKGLAIYLSGFLSTPKMTANKKKLFNQFNFLIGSSGYLEMQLAGNGESFIV